MIYTQLEDNFDVHRNRQFDSRWGKPEEQEADNFEFDEINRYSRYVCELPYKNMASI